VISLDNDHDCIKHMSKQYAADSRLRWYHYDLVTSEGTHAEEVRGLTEQCDIIVDKGTLDAIMVEGSCFQMLAEVYRLLKPTGTYLLCSIHKPELLEKLLTIPSLNFTVQFSAQDGSSDVSSQLFSSEVKNFMGTVAFVKRKNPLIGPEELDFDQLASEEENVMNEYFKVEQPYLTPESESRIRSQFNEWCDSSGMNAEVPSVPVDVAFTIMFSDTSDYTYDLFLEDMVSFPLAAEGQLRLDEALRFIEQMQ
jgi:hypothetical protein